MEDQINAVIAQRYRPVIYVDSWLLTQEYGQKELKDLMQQAAELNVKVVLTKQAHQLHAFNKLYVFRYGIIPMTTAAIIVRRKGIIVPGPF